MKPALKPLKRQFSDFDVSNADISKLDRCVSCGAKWTSRKSTDQKLLHIRRCAKKHRLEDETVKVLIRNQLKEVAADGPSVKAGPSNQVPRPTLLEEVAGVSSSKAKVSKSKTSVKTTNVAHEIIRERANVLLGASTSSSTTMYPNPMLQSVDPRNTERTSANLASSGTSDSVQLVEVPALPSTQTFQLSSLQTKLGGNLLSLRSTSPALARTRALGMSSSTSEDIPLMPSTQAFGISNLQSRLTGSILPSGALLMARARQEEISAPLNDDVDFVSFHTLLSEES